MEAWLEAILIVGVGIVGAGIGLATRVPSGAMLGALAAVAVLQVLSDGQRQLDPGWSIAAQIIVGAVLGSSLDRDAMRAFRRILVPGALAVAVMLVTGLVVGLTIARLGVVEPATALFGMAPGGVAEMSAAAISLGAAGPIVVMMHTVRILAVTALLPFLLRPLSRRAIRPPEPRPAVPPADRSDDDY
jgi:membrane AbrB-like protein